MWFVLPQDYQVLNLLGKGGFACVYRARSNKTGQEVAIKMVSKTKYIVIYAWSIDVTLWDDVSYVNCYVL